MSRIAYVNGRYVPHREAAVHIEDRGYQFADGVYEVTAVRDGKLIDEDRHLERLARGVVANDGEDLRFPISSSSGFSSPFSFFLSIPCSALGGDKELERALRIVLSARFFLIAISDDGR